MSPVGWVLQVERVCAEHPSWDFKIRRLLNGVWTAGWFGDAAEGDFAFGEGDSPGTAALAAVVDLHRRAASLEKGAENV